MEKNIQNSISGAVVLIGLLVIGFLALLRLDQYLKNMAIADCAKVAVYTRDTIKMGENGEQITTRTQEPIRDLYKTCIEDKGYTTSISP